MHLFLSRHQALDEDEQALLPLQQQLTQSGRLNYLRHKQGRLTKADLNGAMVADRLVFHRAYADFVVDEPGNGLPKDVRVRIPSPCLGQNHRDV
eukprot:2711929-Alexandrium_andersonii.AAC.1